MEQEITQKNSDKLWSSSWLILGSALYAFYKRRFFLGLIPLGVFFTSLKYWKNGNDINSRKLDIIALIIGCIIQLGYAQYIDNALNYYIVLTIGIVFWVLSNILNFSGTSVGLSIICHQLFHLFGSLSNVILYSSK